MNSIARLAPASGPAARQDPAGVPPRTVRTPSLSASPTPVENGSHMTTRTQTSRSAGLLCLTAAALIVSSEFLRLAVGLTSGDSAATLTHTLTYGLALVGMCALLLAISAVYAGHQQALGRLGLIGYVTAIMGTVLVAGDWWFEAFVVPMIGAQAPEILNLPAGGSVLVGALITVGLFAAGWITFGVAVLSSGALSRTAGVLLVVGGVCGILALSTPYQIPLAVAVAWMGSSLIRASRQELPVPRTAASASGAAGGLPSR
jgi:hypothetical protein